MSERVQSTATGNGRFITLEGTEGAGKSTHVDGMREVLERAGKRVLITREPGGTPVAEAIRTLLLDPANKGMANDTELLLVFAARADHIERVVRPALRDGVWVVCDRFTDATYAYQGGGRRIPEQRIGVLEQWVQGELCPDLTLVLDVQVALGLARAGRRSTSDRFEQEESSFFERVRDTYLARARRFPQRYRVIDATGDIDSVREKIAHALGELL